MLNTILQGIVEWFRSLAALCFSVSLSAVNVLRGLAAAPLAIPAPGDENRRFAVLSTYAVWLFGYGRDATSL